MHPESRQDLLLQIENLKLRLAESEQLIEAIKAGEVDAFAFNTENVPEIYTVQSGDYAYRVLIEEFGEGAVNLSEEGLIVYTNTYFFELLNLKYEKVIGRKITDFIDADSIVVFRELFKKSVLGKSKGEINLRIDEQKIPVYISLTSLQPKLPTVGMIITDQTAIKKHESIVKRYQQDLENKNKALAQSNHELNSFTYIASHDLQEPLRKIQVYSQRILDECSHELSATSKDYFVRIGNASQRMQHMITSLLDYSRMSSGEIARTTIDLNKLIKEVIDDSLDEEERKQVTIAAELLPSIIGIPEQIRQLFTNLLSNAFKYRKADLPLEIRVLSEKENDFWKITVADNGIGFDPQFSEKIFDLFQRLHTRFEFEGTGIGLAICKKVVQNHMGNLKAYGFPEKGAAFEIYFPDEIAI